MCGKMYLGVTCSMNNNLFINILAGKVYRLTIHGSNPQKPVVEWITHEEVLKYINSQELPKEGVYLQKYANDNWRVPPWAFSGNIVDLIDV